MKYLRISMFIILSSLMVSIFTSCRDDDDDTPSSVSNVFNYNGADYALTQGYIAELGEIEEDGVFDFEIYFFSEDFVVTNYNETPSGKGEAIYLDLYISTSELEDGTYNYSDELGSFTLFDGIVAIDYDFRNETGTELDVIGGKVEIKTDGNNKAIDFELRMSNGSMIEGNYTGELQRL